MNACPVVSVERDDLSRGTSSAARRLRLAPAPHGRRRYSPRPRLRLSTRFTSVTRLQPPFPSACFTWTSLRVILLVFGRVSIEGCSRTTPRLLPIRRLASVWTSNPSLHFAGYSRRSATTYIYSDSINSCISFLGSTAPTAIVLLANRGPGCHSVVPAAVVSAIETHCYAPFTEPSTAATSC
ncbi:hypothetical protein C8R45DRAFT_974324 [Mycena sanguinolenta]|nr:hypothetical protein C8R45DRAFT_974324 [Mycena sanguinolenta]